MKKKEYIVTVANKPAVGQEFVPIDKFYDTVLVNDKAVVKHLWKHHWISGSSTVVYPVETDLVSYEVNLQWDSSNLNTAKWLMTRMLRYSNVTYVHFQRSDGSCPSEVTIRFKRPN